MSSLLEKFAGKIDLIYIDPPFATGADFRINIAVGESGDEVIKEHSVIEEKAYRDTWGQGLESYLMMMFERLHLMKDLLSDKGCIYIHLDWRMASYIRILMDEILGSDNYIREIIWRMGWISGYKTIANNWIRNHDNILFYAKDPENFTFNKKWIPYPPNYERWGGREKGQGLAIEDVWGVFPGEGVNSLAVISFAKENLGYPTQKAEGLLQRIIEVSSNEGDLVADFFCGSGSTCAVAEKLNRRWIGVDLGRYSIHTTRKRLLEIENSKSLTDGDKKYGKKVRPFEILNLGKYERQFWQVKAFGRKDEKQALYEYLAFILKLYGAEPIAGSSHIHGKKGNALVYIGAVDAPVTIQEVTDALQDTKDMGQKELHVLGWEWEMGLNDAIQEVAKQMGVRLKLRIIPMDAIDPQASGKGDVKFFELAYFKTEIETKGLKVKVKLEDFVIPHTDLIPPDVKESIKKWSDWIDYWAVDFEFQNDTFNNGWTSYRTKKERKLRLVADYEYPKAGTYKIFVKIIDIFGIDTSQVYEIKVK
jgi:DNA modification methylase